LAARLSGQTASTRWPTIKSIWKGPSLVVFDEIADQHQDSFACHDSVPIGENGSTVQGGQDFLSAKCAALFCGRQDVRLTLAETGYSSSSLRDFNSYCSGRARSRRPLDRQTKSMPMRSRNDDKIGHHVDGAVDALACYWCRLGAGRLGQGGGVYDSSRLTRRGRFVLPATVVAQRSLLRSHFEIHLFYPHFPMQ